jgi:hypothetical protein
MTVFVRVYVCAYGCVCMCAHMGAFACMGAMCKCAQREMGDFGGKQRGYGGRVQVRDGGLTTSSDYCAKPAKTFAVCVLIPLGKGCGVSLYSTVPLSPWFPHSPDALCIPSFCGLRAHSFVGEGCGVSLYSNVPLGPSGPPIPVMHCAYQER